MRVDCIYVYVQHHILLTSFYCCGSSLTLEVAQRCADVALLDDVSSLIHIGLDLPRSTPACKRFVERIDADNLTVSSTVQHQEMPCLVACRNRCQYDLGGAQYGGNRNRLHLAGFASKPAAKQR